MESSYWISRREQPGLPSVRTLLHTSLTEALQTSEVIQKRRADAARMRADP